MSRYREDLTDLDLDAYEAGGPMSGKPLPPSRSIGTRARALARIAENYERDPFEGAFGRALAEAYDAGNCDRFNYPEQEGT